MKRFHDVSAQPIEGQASWGTVATGCINYYLSTIDIKIKTFKSIKSFLKLHVQNVQNAS